MLRGTSYDLQSYLLEVKSVQSALSDLLTTSAMHGTFSSPSTKRGLILIGLELNTSVRESFERGGVNGELFLGSYFKASYFGELFLCKLDYLK